MELLLENLTCGYGARPVLDRLSRRFTPGLWLLTGPNGCGKSTLLRTLAGALPPLGGRVLWDGEDAYWLESRYRSRLGYVPQHLGALPPLTVGEYLRYLAAAKGLRPGRTAGRIAEVAGLVGLAGWEPIRVSGLSSGMKRRVALAQALLGDPDLLLVDEPEVGLDPQEQLRLAALLTALAADRVVLMASHQPNMLRPDGVISLGVTR